MTKQYRSAAMASIHETAEGLHNTGVMDKQTMRKFDDAWASQAVFARYLNVTTGLISQWERGEKHPQGASLKLLSLVAKNGLMMVA